MRRANATFGYWHERRRWKGIEDKKITAKRRPTDRELSKALARALRKGDPEVKIAAENEPSLNCFRFDEGALCQLKGKQCGARCVPVVSFGLCLRRTTSELMRAGKATGRSLP